ncbi:adiponectin-like [Ruditapes philippinarum]|uniref:adiponectin-like n=1 Tax=Ruditapes philippinarum TaxID=129788 RepID=UPI00295ACF57|nr:adiponectin-like [Ruditapes philippinarum]
MDTLGVIKKTVQEFTGKFDILNINITGQMLENTQLIEKKIKFFEKLYEAVRVNFTQEIENQRNSVVALQGKYERPTVAFCVHKVTDVLLDTSNEVIVFNSIITNEGSGYDTSTGIFTAPVAGLYQFAVHLCTPISYYTYVGIYHEGKIIVKDYIHGVGQHAMCNSVGGVVRVESGEQVWVQSRSAGSNRKLTDDNSRMNTFFGILIDS